MGARPAGQTLKGNAYAIQAGSNGDLWWITGGTNLFHHVWETGKTVQITCPASRHFVLVGDDKLAAGSFDYDAQRAQGVLAERETGKVLRTVTISDENETISTVAASPDGEVLAFALAGRIEIFQGTKRLPAIEGETCGAVFSSDGSQLVYLAGGELHRLEPGKKKPQSVKCRAAEWGTDPRLTRQGKYLLLQMVGFGHKHTAFVIDEKTGKVALEVEPSEVCSWGPDPDTIVWCVEEKVKVLDLKGKTIASFKRPRKSRFETASPSPKGWWVAAGSFVELYDFSRIDELAGGKGPKKRKKVEFAAPKKRGTSDADIEAKLKAAIWANRDDKEAIGVYADFLVERGESLGEYLQLSLLENPTDAQYARMKALRAKDRGKWLGAARPFVRTWEERDGFVEWLETEAPLFVKGFEELVALGPQVRINVTSLRKKTRATIADMVKLPLKKVRHLGLGSNGLEDSFLELLAPGLAGVERLDLSGNPITGKGLCAVGASASGIKFLGLSGESPEVVADLANAILETPGFRSLVHIHFFRSLQPSADLLKKLRAMPAMRKIGFKSYPGGDVLSDEALKPD